jgi:hypothetical protein
MAIAALADSIHTALIASTAVAAPLAGNESARSELERRGRKFRRALADLADELDRVLNAAAL